MDCERTTAGISASERTAREHGLVIENLPRVRATVNRLAQRLPPAVDREELVQGGMLGLIDAARRFDPSQGCSFGSYAEIRIRGAVLDQLRALDWVPRTLRRSERALERGRRAVEQREGRAAESEEVADQLGLTAEGFEALRSQREFSLCHAEYELDQAESSCWADWPRRECEATNPLRALDTRREQQAISDAIAELPRAERDVVSLCYWEELLPEAISRALGLDLNRVRNLHARGLLRLRGRLRELWA